MAIYYAHERKYDFPLKYYPYKENKKPFPHYQLPVLPGRENKTTP